MAGGVNVKMGVSGVAQFKKNIKDAKEAVKTLDSQLALTEKQFKANGDSEEYMVKKTEELKAKLEAQKTVVDNAEKALKDMAEKGIDKSSKAYQDMYRQMLNAKGEMIDTQSAINGVADASADAATEVNTMSDQLDGIGKGISFENVTSGLEKITGGLEAAAKKAYKLGSTIAKEVLGVGGWADDINTRSKVLGVPVDELQRMEKTARLIDTDAETIIKARQKLLKNIGGGNSGALSALEALGISTEGGDYESIFWKAGEAIMNLGDEAEQEAQANAIFGRSWHDLIPLFDAGREKYEEMNASWNVMSAEQIDQLNEMDDEYQKLQIAVEDLKREALSNFAKPMQTCLEAINGILGDISKWLGSEEGQQTVQSIMDGIRNALDWIMNNKESVATAIGAIAAAFVGLKTALFGLNIAKTVSGLSNLLGNGSKAASNGATQAAAAGSGGGWMTGLMNGLTAKSAGANGIMAMMGNLAPVMMDMFMNQTNAGRGVRDGGGWAGFWGGLQQDMSEAVETVKQNTETFASDWQDVFENNPIFKVFTRRDANADAAERLGTTNWLPSYMGGAIGAIPIDQAAQKLETAAEDLGVGGSIYNRNLGYESEGLRKDEILEAIQQGLSETPVNSYLDGELVTAAVSRRLAEQLANRRYVK